MRLRPNHTPDDQAATSGPPPRLVTSHAADGALPRGGGRRGRRSQAGGLREVVAPRWRTGAVALAALVALAGCTSNGPSLPRVGGGASASPGSGDLVAVAKQFHDCLTDAGLPAIYTNDEDGRPTRVSFDESVPVVGIDAEGMPFANNAGYDTKFDQFFTAPDLTKPTLEVNGVDRTETWTTCLDKSGYKVSATFNTISNNVYMQEMWRLAVDSSNQWASCARQHGFPETKDAVMPTDNNSAPTALLPASITEPQLRQLLIDCPSFDVEQAKKNDELYSKATAADPAAAAGIPDGVVLPPSIGFDYPGFRGNFAEYSMGADQSADPTAAKLMNLMLIVTQPMTDYYAAQGPAMEATG